MNGKSVRVLLVEDNPGDVRLLRAALAGTNTVQLELTETKDLNDAFRQIDAENFDVILLDLSLPDAWGFDTIMRMHKYAPKVPIVILTGTDDETLAVKTVQMGAQDYLVKGQTDGNLLIRTIRHAIERHRLRQDLEQQMNAYLHSEARFHNMIEHNADGITIVDQDGIVRFVNPATELLFACSTDELLDKPFSFPLITGQVTEVKISRKNAPEDVVFAEVRIVETTWDNKPAYLASLRDITERKLAETELSNYRDHLETLVQERTTRLEQALIDIVTAHDKIDAILKSVADGLIVTDLKYRVILANPAAIALFEVDLPDDLIGKQIGIDNKHTWLRELVQSSLRHQVSDCEVDVKLKDLHSGRPKIIQARTALVDDHRGELIGTVTIIRDVTRLREVDYLKSEFLKMAAHELRTPLTSILGFSEILSDRPLDNTRQQRYIKMINEQAVHLSEIVSNLIDISRLEAGGGMELNRQTFNLEHLLNQVAHSISDSKNKHIIQLEDLTDLPPVLGDTARMKQLFKNLISNAIKYSPNGGIITIRSQITPGFVQVSIQDQGIGIKPEQQSRIFEQFYRADTSNTAIGGTGLGLTICRLIINLHGGDIWIESRYGHGTTVHITVPVVEEPIKV